MGKILILPGGAAVAAMGGAEAARWSRGLLVRLRPPAGGSCVAVWTRMVLLCMWIVQALGGMLNTRAQASSLRPSRNGWQ